MSSLVLAQPPGDVDAVQARQAEVEHDQVGQEGVDVVERLHAVPGELDLVALQAQRALQHLGDVLVVLDDEDADRAVGRLHEHKDSTSADQAQLCPAGQEPRPPRRTVPGRMPAAARRKPSARARRPRRRRRGATGCPGSSSATGTSSASGSSRWPSSSPSSSTSAGTAARAARRSSTACARLLGAVHHLVPVALLAAGVIVVMRPVAAGRAARSGRRRRACSPAATLGLAAGTLGVGSGPAEERGGLVGEALLELTSTLLGTVGAHIVALFCLVGGRAPADRRQRRLGGQGDRRLVSRPRDGGCATGPTEARTVVARRRSRARRSSRRSRRSGEPTAVASRRRTSCRTSGRAPSASPTSTTGQARRTSRGRAEPAPEPEAQPEVG